MFHLSPPSFALFGLGAAELSMVIAIFGLVFGCLMGIAGMYFNHQRQRLWHETARLALEKGQPIPSQIPEDKFEHASSGDILRHHDLRGGLILIAVGASLFLFLRIISAPGSSGVAAVGLIPAFIGFSLLVHYVLTTLIRARKSDSTPPRS